MQNSKKIIINSKNYYTNRYHNDFKRLKAYEQEREFILKNIKKKNFKHLSILDIGSGTGEMLDFFKVDKKKTLCLENSKYALSVLKKKSYKTINEKNILKNSYKFDLIILRGSIQYFLNPYTFLISLSKMLKKRSYIIFLQTPNSSSLSFYFNKNLSFLEFNKMYFIPNRNSLTYFLNQINLKEIKFELPYLNSPYRNLIIDILSFIKNIFGYKNLNYSFPGNVFNAIYQKK